MTLLRRIKRVPNTRDQAWRHTLTAALPTIHQLKDHLDGVMMYTTFTGLIILCSAYMARSAYDIAFGSDDDLTRFVTVSM